MICYTTLDVKRKASGEEKNIVCETVSKPLPSTAIVFCESCAHGCLTLVIQSVLFATVTRLSTVHLFFATVN